MIDEPGCVAIVERAAEFGEKFFKEVGGFGVGEVGKELEVEVAARSVEERVGKILQREW
ncbi:MAG: hypothetical protein ABI706_00550 [Ilumatobacteraceae bacterium]